MIAVTLNGEARRFASAPTVDSVVEALGCGRRGVAVAVNSEIVPRSAWSSTLLADGDAVEVLNAVSGGC